MKTKQLLLSLLALFVSITAKAEYPWDFQAGGFYYIITSSNSVCVTYSYYDEDEGTYFGGYSGSKTIPSSVTYNATTYNVTAIGDHAFENCPALTSVTIPNSVTSIGVDAFSDCSSLNSISIPNSVASIARGALTYTAWYDNQPDGLLYAGKVAYSYIGEMPQGTNIVLKDGTLGIADAAFAYQGNLTSITIPNSVTNIGAEAFYNCSDLNPIIPNSVISVGYRALDNTAWRSNQPDGVLYAGKVAYGYKGVMSEGTNIVLEEGTTAITDYAFYYQSHLTSITIPSSVTNIGPWAFYYCSGLTSVTCNRETPPSATASFPGAPSVTLYVPLGSKTAYMASVWSYFKEIIEDAGPSITFTDDAVKALCVSNWDTTGDGELGEKEAAAVTDIGTVFKNNGSISSFNELQYFTGLTSLTYDSFYGCSSLASITIPKNINTINSNPFQFCKVLVNIVVANDNTTFDSRDNCNAIIETASNTLVCGCGNSAVPNTVTSIGRNAFSDTSLSSIIIPEGVTSIGEHAFAQCYSLTEVSIPESVTSIGGGAFYDCRSLRKAYFTNLASLCGITFQWSIKDGEEYSSNPLFYAQDLYVDGELLSGDVVIPEGVETIASSAFYKRENITSVHIPSSVTGIGSYAFYGCSSLSFVNLPNIRNIYSYTFYGCPLTSITIPSSVIRIYDYAFRFCNTLTDVVLSDNLIEIGKQAFEGCSNLEAITIPKSVTSIGSGAFYNCENLTSMTVNWESPISIQYSDVFPYRTNAILNVPYGSSSAYMAAYFWRDFKSIVEMTSCAATIGSSGLATFCSYAPLDFTGVSGLKAYIASGFEPSTGTLVLTRALKVPAGEGLYLVGDAGTYEVPISETDMVYSNLLVGVTSATTISPTDGTNTNFILANGSHGVGFYTLATAGELAAGKAYLQLPTASLSSGVKAISVIFDDDETAIQSIKEETNEQGIYNLQGQQVNAPKSGLYIINGKKIFIK